MNKPYLLCFTPVALALLALSAQATTAPELTSQPPLSAHIATVIQAQPVIPIRIEVYPLRVSQNDLDHDAVSAA